MTSNRDLAPTVPIDTPRAVLVAERPIAMANPRRTARAPRVRAFGQDGRCQYAPTTNAVTIGHLVVTPVSDFSDVKPAAVDSIAVHSTRPDAPGSTVLLYRRRVRSPGRSERGYYALPAKTVLSKPDPSTAVLTNPDLVGPRSA